MRIMGIHGFSYKKNRKLHDTGVAIIDNGKILAAVDEERYSRVKNEGSFPVRALEDIYNVTCTKSEDIDVVAMPDKSHIWQLKKVLRYAFKTYFETGILMHRYVFKALIRAIDNKRHIPENLSHAKKIYVEHHLAHAASAYYTCPWNEATIITVDGMGDYSMSGIIGTGVNGKINVIQRLNGFYSPGLFYSIITDYLGFTAGRHEGKVTGLAAFGDYSELIEELSDFLSYNSKTNDFQSKIMPFEIDRYSFEYGKKEKLYLFTKLLSNHSKENIAAATQKILENSVTELIKNAVKKTGLKKIVLAGGVFANVKLNQKIKELSCVDDIYIFPAMSDSGLSIGAALYANFMIYNNKFEPKPLVDVFLGKGYTNKNIEKLLISNEIVFERPESIEHQIAIYLATGKIVAHFNGRMEYGPRALGNRSILVQATDFSINKELNKRLRRTEFMPFAPAILEEYANEYLENWNMNDIASQFMTITYNVTDKMKLKTPAVVHIDGTARPQIVNSKGISRFYKILMEYNKITGIPLVVNTSFNIHEEPIVNTPQEALNILKQNSVDILILNDFVVKNIKESKL